LKISRISAAIPKVTILVPKTVSMHSTRSGVTIGGNWDDGENSAAALSVGVGRGVKVWLNVKLLDGVNLLDIVNLLLSVQVRLIVNTCEGDRVRKTLQYPVSLRRCPFLRIVEM
jgi:hypothetical protein